MNKIVDKLAIVFDNYPHQHLNNVFSLPNFIISIIEDHSLKDYKLTHMIEQKMERLGIVPQSISETEAAAVLDEPVKRDKNEEHERNAEV